LKLGLYTDIGTATCRGGRPGSYGNYQRDAQTLAAWGVDLVKTDNCHRPEPGVKLYANFSAALNATGRPMIFSLCNWGTENVWEWGASVAHIYRFNMDHLPFWTFPPFGAGAGYGQGTVDIIEFYATFGSNMTAYNGPYGYMDPDFLETLFDPSMNFIDSRTEFSFWSLWSAPLIVSTDIRDMDDQKKSIVLNAEVIAIDQDSNGSPGFRVRNSTDGGEVWVKPLANGDMAGILFNSGDDSPVTVTLYWADLGWPSTASVTLRDLWAGKDIGPLTSEYSTSVDPHDVFFFRAKRV